MDRVDLEALVVLLIDRVQRNGYAVEYEVEDAASLRELLWHEARNRGLEVRTGTVTADDRAVWVYQPKEDSGAARRIATEAE